MSEPTLKPCPFCGSIPEADDPDFCYPQNRERTLWRAGCCHGPCQAEVLGSTADAAIAAWNTRAADAEAALDSAFAAGAEAMRESAAELGDERVAAHDADAAMWSMKMNRTLETDLCGERSREAEDYACAIRALPLPTRPKGE